MLPPNPQTMPFGPAAIAVAARLIRAGGIVAVPAETVYGLAADATNAEGVARIYAAKGRPAFNPLIVHVADLAAARRIARFDGVAENLAERFWPGPLTLVLPRLAGNGIAALATAGLDTIALRIPASKPFRQLIAAAARPLAAPSANASGAISPTLARHVVASLADRVPLVIDGGPTRHGLESTIVMLADGCPRILREGPVTAEMLGLPGGGGDDAIVAPGQLAGHYAPAKPLRLDGTQARPEEYLIGFGAIAGDATLSSAGDLTEAAARLFDLLHQADASPAAAIAVAPIPVAGIGAAINDRLRRAAHRSWPSSAERSC